MWFLKMNKWKNNNPFYLGGAYPREMKELTLKGTLLEIWMEEPLPWMGGSEDPQFSAWINTYLLWTESHTCCKTLPCPKLCLQTLKIDFFLGQTVHLKVLCKRTAGTHWETSHGRPCFFFLANTIHHFKCVKWGALLRRSEGIYIPLKNCDCSWCPK